MSVLHFCIRAFKISQDHKRAGISIREHLAVTEPLTEIVGGPDIYVEEGATMNLSCVVSGSSANQSPVS